MNYEAGSYDIAVIGAGHAGIEAALAAARLGKGWKEIAEGSPRAAARAKTE